MGGGSKAVWNFSENSSVLEGVSVPYIERCPVPPTSFHSAPRTSVTPDLESLTPVSTAGQAQVRVHNDGETKEADNFVWRQD